MSLICLACGGDQGLVFAATLGELTEAAHESYGAILEDGMRIILTYTDPSDRCVVMRTEEHFTAFVRHGGPAPLRCAVQQEAPHPSPSKRPPTVSETPPVVLKAPPPKVPVKVPVARSAVNVPGAAMQPPVTTDHSDLLLQLKNRMGQLGLVEVTVAPAVAMPHVPEMRSEEEEVHTASRGVISTHQVSSRTIRGPSCTPTPPDTLHTLPSSLSIPQIRPRPTSRSEEKEVTSPTPQVISPERHVELLMDLEMSALIVEEVPPELEQEDMPMASSARRKRHPTYPWVLMIALCSSAVWLLGLVAELKISCGLGLSGQWTAVVVPVVLGPPVVGLLAWFLILIPIKLSGADADPFIWISLRAWMWFSAVAVACCIPLAMTCGQIHAAESIVVPSKSTIIHCWENPTDPIDIARRHFITLLESEWRVDWRSGWKQKVVGRFCLAPMVYVGEAPGCSYRFYAACDADTEGTWEEEGRTAVASCGEVAAASCRWDLPSRNVILRITNTAEDFFNAEGAAMYLRAASLISDPVGAIPVDYDNPGPEGVKAHRDAAEISVRTQYAVVLVLFFLTMGLHTLTLVNSVPVK